MSNEKRIPGALQEHAQAPEHGTISQVNPRNIAWLITLIESIERKMYYSGIGRPSRLVRQGVATKTGD
jgi:hypothetical protein